MESDLYSSEKGRLRRLRRRLWLERAFFLLVIAGLVSYQRGALPGGRRVCLVAVEGQPVTVVASQREAERLLEEIKRAALPPQLAQQAEAGRVEFAQRITFHRVPADRNPVAPEAKAMAALSARLQPVIQAAAVLANGQVVVALPDRAEATKLLSRLLREFAPPGDGFTTVFKEEVRVEERRVPVDRFVESPEAAVRKIREETAPAAIHEVQPGETAWKIAAEAKVSLHRLAQANPGMDINKLRAGDQVKIPGKAAPITVVAQKEIHEPVGEGARRRLQVVRLTYENGAQVSRQVIGYRPMPGPPGAGERGGRPARDSRAPAPGPGEGE